MSSTATPPATASPAAIRCPPGPGYWPIDAPEHPSQLGWRNPTHAIARRAFPDGATDLGSVLVSEQPSAATATVWDKPPDRRNARQRGQLPLRPGERFPLLDLSAGREAGTATGADGYRLSYRLALPAGGDGWLRAAVPLPIDVGLDGRPASVWLDLLPDQMAQ